MIRDGRPRRMQDDRRRGRTQLLAPWSKNACGVGVRALFSLSQVAYPANNLALGYPFIVEEEKFVISEAWIDSVANGSGNIDIGVYDRTYAKISSTGSTAWTSQNAIQAISFSLTLTPGRYFAVIAASSTGIGTNSFKSNSGDGLFFRLWGCFRMATAFALPSTITPAVYSDDNLPSFGFTGASVI